MNGAQCGDATVANTNLIEAGAHPRDKVRTTIVVDQSGGPLFDRPFMWINYIENVIIVGTPAADTITAGTFGDDALIDTDADGNTDVSVRNNSSTPGLELDAIRGGGGNDTLSLRGFGGDPEVARSGVILRGDAGADTLHGSSHADTLHGDAGADTLHGYNGADHLNGGTANDHLNGGLHNDTIYGLDGNDQLYGVDGNDYLSGGNHDDTLSGGDHNDELYGGEGTDSLAGGPGDDTLSGGPGTDTCSQGGGTGPVAACNP